MLPLFEINRDVLDAWLQAVASLDFDVRLNKEFSDWNSAAGRVTEEWEISSPGQFANVSARMLPANMVELALLSSEQIEHILKLSLMCCGARALTFPRAIPWFSTGQGREPLRRLICRTSDSLRRAGWAVCSDNAFPQYDGEYLSMIATRGLRKRRLVFSTTVGESGPVACVGLLRAPLRRRLFDNRVEDVVRLLR